MNPRSFPLVKTHHLAANMVDMYGYLQYKYILTLVPDFIGLPKSQLRYLVWFSVS